jgi:hypothetical protein
VLHDLAVRYAEHVDGPHLHPLASGSEALELPLMRAAHHDAGSHPIPFGHHLLDGDAEIREAHAIQDQITVVQQDLSKLEEVDTGMTRIEFLRHLLMSMTSGVDHTYFGYARPARGEDKRHLVVTAHPDHPSFFTSSQDRSMVERQEFYRKMNLSVRVHDEDLKVEIATPAISQSEDPS